MNEHNQIKTVVWTDFLVISLKWKLFLQMPCSILVPRKQIKETESVFMKFENII
jgi:hypothetical protein